MIFTPTTIEGAVLVDVEPVADERGTFARTFCQKEFSAAGLETEFVQSSSSRSTRRGTLRGLHAQRAPHEEVKLVRCTRGAVFDVILDLRPQSDSFLRHFAVELSAENTRTLYVPRGVYHGFLTLEDDSEVSYRMSAFHAPSHATGVRWNDPRFGIEWPHEVKVISERDASYPDYTTEPSSRS